MADRDLIQGAAVLAQAEGNMSRALGAGITQEATRIADDIIKKENERIAQVKNDMNLAAQFISKMASTGTASGQYRDILTQEGINTKNRLNEIALDNSLNAVEKAAAYTQAVDEYNTLASTYGADQEKLVSLQGVVRSGNYSNTINRDTEEFGIARELGLGNYKIVKDGYLVNGKKITSAELDQYIQLYKPKNIEGFSKFETQLRNSITSAKGKKDIENSFVNTALAIPIDQKLDYLVDYKGQAYNNFFQDGKINEDVVKTAFATEMNNLRNESAVAPLVETSVSDSSIGAQYYNLFKQRFSESNTLISLLDDFNIKKGTRLDDDPKDKNKFSIIDDIELTNDGLVLKLTQSTGQGRSKTEKQVEEIYQPNEAISLILANISLTPSQKQELQLKLIQDPILFPNINQQEQQESNQSPTPASNSFSFLKNMQRALGFGN